MLDWRSGLRFRLVVTVLMALSCAVTLSALFALFAHLAAQTQRSIVELAQARLQSQVLLAAAGQQRIAAHGAHLPAALDSSALGQALAETPLPGEAGLWVLDRRSTVVAAHPASQGRRKTLGSTEQDATVLTAQRHGRPGLHEAPDSQGIWQTYAYAPVGGTGDGLFVVMQVPRDALTAGAQQPLWAYILAWLGMGAFGMMAVWWLGGRMVVQPARAILKAAKGITQGDLSNRVQPDVSARPLHDAGHRLIGGVTVNTDITDLKTLQADMQGQQDVLALIAGSAPLAQSLAAIVQLIQRRDAACMCNLSLLKRGRLYSAAAVGLPASFLEKVEGVAADEGGGACGVAALQGQRVIVENTALDPTTPTTPTTQVFSDVLAAHNLQACWSSPVLSADGTVLAVFAVYHHTPCAPQPRHIDLLDTAVRLTRIALERASSETALISSEARFRVLAENIQDVFYNCDARTGQVRYISPAYEKVWGRSCDSLYANRHAYLDAVLPEDAPLQIKARKRQSRDRLCDEQYRILNASGQVRWIRDISYPVFDASGQLECIVGTARDITQRKLTELALFRSNRAMQLLSRTSVAISRAEQEADLLAEVCRIAVEIGGYRTAWVGYALDDDTRSIEPVAHAGHAPGGLAFLKLSWSDVYPAGQGPAGKTIRTSVPHHIGDIAQTDMPFAHRQEALAQGYRSALYLPLRDGPHTFGLLGLYADHVQDFPLEETQPLQELAEQLAFGIGSLRVRLERSRAQELARQAAVQLSEQASLLDRTHDAIMVRNLDLTIRYWNKGAEHLYGWTAQEVLGKTMAEQLHGQPQMLAEQMSQLLASGGEWTGELEKRTRSGRAVYVQARWVVMRDDADQINGVMVINTDITERKRVRDEILWLNANLEERVQQRTTQLAFANRQLEGFSYSLSHDLRTPLSGVDGFCQLLAKSLPQDDNNATAVRQQHYLSRIRSGVVQMGELIDVMLALAQVSRKTLRWEPVDLSALAQTLVSRYQKQEPERSARVYIAPGLQAVGDPQLLRQVLDNLLGNAWKFCASRPLTQITFGCETSGHETVYFVRDNGAGFDMAYAGKLFVAFERLHSPSEFAGAGIGLTTVQRIISRHGGRVWGEAVLDEGATFYFTLGSAAL
ncbi:MAG: PAS domain S-box protein [Polaromonas sp.]|nr:MAG: PAS domain S-box protein [Polaromonas sp.]